MHPSFLPFFSSLRVCWLLLIFNVTHAPDMKVSRVNENKWAHMCAGFGAQSQVPSQSARRASRIMHRFPSLWHCLKMRDNFQTESTVNVILRAKGHQNSLSTAAQSDLCLGGIPPPSTNASSALQQPYTLPLLWKLAYYSGPKNISQATGLAKCTR